MNKRTIKLLVLWNVALTVLLLASVAFNASLAQAAIDPPVKIYTAHADSIGGDHSQSTAGMSVNKSTGYDTLLSTSVSLSTSSTCLVTASASVNAAGSSSTHDVGLNVDSTTSVKAASDREIYFPTTVGVNEVTTVYGFDNLTGSHTFDFLATGTPAMSVSARSMIVACFSARL